VNQLEYSISQLSLKVDTLSLQQQAFQAAEPENQPLKHEEEFKAEVAEPVVLTHLDFILRSSAHFDLTKEPLKMNATSGSTQMEFNIFLGELHRIEFEV
jgi:hypothetical protein